MGKVFTVQVAYEHILIFWSQIYQVRWSYISISSDDDAAILVPESFSDGIR